MSFDLNSLIEKQADINFSGTAYAKIGTDIVLDTSFGKANRSYNILNEPITRFGIASGCKIFTAVAISQLVEKGKIQYDTLLEDCLDIELPKFEKDITIHHLLTHTSGVPDYFDEDVMDDFEELWICTPMYHIRELKDFLPLFQNEKMKHKVGEKFHYNNAGYILLGLIVEQVANCKFTNYVEKHIFQKAGMKDSGYFEMDALPERTSLGYIDQEDGTWKINIYSLPAKGGSDGGAFVTAPDMVKFWDALMNQQLLDKEFTKQLLTDHVNVKGNRHYGYGVWIDNNERGVEKYHVMGYDPGVSFHSAYYPESNLTVAVCSNKSSGAFPVFQEIERQLR